MARKRPAGSASTHPPSFSQMNCNHWLVRLANLNAAKSASLGIAPHKPLMIFSVMDLIEMGAIRDRWVAYNADLVTRFRDYWDLVVERRKNRPEITISR
jgi:putative restriction endonuclease